jgi:hypothetical protein
MKNFPEQPFDMGDPHGFTCPHDSIKEYKDLKLIEGGGHTHPGRSHTGPNLDAEWDFFQKVLDNVDSGRRKPVMLEIGCLWGLWSMSFKQRFPKGKNILVEPEPLRLGCGLKNFELNGMECIYFHGHCGAATPSKAGGFSEAGEHISIDSIISKTRVSNIDVIHMDAQGAEFGIVPEIKDSIDKGFFKNLVIFTHADRGNLLKILNESPAVEVVETGTHEDAYIYAKAK